MFIILSKQVCNYVQTPSDKTQEHFMLKSVIWDLIMQAIVCDHHHN